MYGYGSSAEFPDAWWDDVEDEREYWERTRSHRTDSMDLEGGTFISTAMRDWLWNQDNPMYQLLLKEIGRLKSIVRTVESELRASDQFVEELSERYDEHRKASRDRDVEISRLHQELQELQEELDLSDQIAAEVRAAELERAEVSDRELVDEGAA